MALVSSGDALELAQFLGWERRARDVDVAAMLADLAYHGLPTTREATEAYARGHANGRAGRAWNAEP